MPLELWGSVDGFCSSANAAWYSTILIRVLGTKEGRQSWC